MYAATQLNSNVRACAAQHKLYLLNDCSYISVVLRLFSVYPCTFVSQYDQKNIAIYRISRYTKNIATYRISRYIAAALLPTNF